jgi:hypothetical protein
MAVTLDFNIKQSDNAKTLIFNEITGIYNASTNAGGYGSPNELHSASTKAELKVTPPGSTTVTTLVLTATFPVNESTTVYNIVTDDITGETADSKFTDGIWTFTYEVTLPSQGLVTRTHKIFISGAARCCVYGMLADLDLTDCDCEPLEKARALEAFTFYRSLIATAACGNSTKFTDLLTLVNKLCAADACKS